MSDDRLKGESSAAADLETAESNERPAAGPPTVTYRCRPAGFTCGLCGAETDTQWVDDGTFVCPDCKSWS